MPENILYYIVQTNPKKEKDFPKYLDNKGLLNPDSGEAQKFLTPEDAEKAIQKVHYKRRPNLIVQPIQESKMHTFKRTGDDGYERLALRVPSKESKESFSVDVVDAQGKLMCRLNTFDFGNGTGNVDVIILDESKQGRLIALLDGKMVINQVIPGTTVFAVQIEPKTEPAS
jgi:hypothetical protein